MLLTILLAFAAFRLTRLVTRDKLPLIDLPREAFVQRWGAWEDAQRAVDSTKRNLLVQMWRWLFAMDWEALGGKRTNLVMKSLAYLWECDWCMGIWVSAGVVFASAQFVSVPWPWLQWLAAAALTGLIAQREEPKK